MIIVNFVDVRLTMRFENTYVSNFARSLARSFSLRDIFETGDKDIKKGRATSCPAGGHWRGINHPREGLHFNARGWISNARASERRSEIASATTGATADATAQWFYATRARRGAMCRLSEVRIPRYRCSGRISGKPVQDDADDKENRSKTDGLVFFFHFFPSHFFSFRSNVCHRISRRSIVVSSVGCNRDSQSVNACTHRYSQLLRIVYFLLGRLISILY